MPSWVVPLGDYPATYNGHPPAVVAFAQKNYSPLYLHAAYASAEEAKACRMAWEVIGKKLNMGRSGVRFQRFDARLIALHEQWRRGESRGVRGLGR